ncbi:hypothetical protein [Chitinimonas naiadis]
MSLKNFLIKAKLVEPDPVEPAETPLDFELIGGSTAVPDVEAPRPPAAPTAATSPTGAIAENTPLDAIYAVFGVPGTTFPAERLLKVLEGLRAMDAANQRAAIAAMDAADDSWAIEDVLADAARKVVALKAHVGKLNEAVASVREQEQSQKAVLTRDYEALRASIAEQIAQLQAAAELAATENANALAALEARTLAASNAGQREQLRIQTEIERLDSIARQLGQPSN